MPSRIEVSVGAVYGDLTVIKEVYSPKRRKFQCQCSCGRKVDVRLDHLRTKHSTSCGRCGIPYKGQRRTLAEWARLHDLKESTLRARLQTMSMRDAIGMGPPR